MFSSMGWNPAGEPSPPRAGSQKSPGELRARVVRAATAALADHSYVSAVDVLCGIGLLAPSNLDAWRKGRVDFLERVVQGNLKKISSALAMFREWARENGLKPSETHYVRRTRDGTVDLRFSASGDPQTELSYRTHFISPSLSAQKQARLQE